MGRRSKSKKYFYFTIICTLLLIFLYNFEVLDAWKTTKFSSSLLLSSTSADLLQQQQDHQQYLEYQNTKHVEQFDDEANSTKLSATKISQPESQLSAPKPIEILEKPWFFKHGDYYPKPAKAKKKRRGREAHLQGSHLFPYQDPHSDRIVNQLMYVPPNYEEVRSSGKLKEILLYNGLFSWNIKAGRDVFLHSKCPVDTCTITVSRNSAYTADMILYKDHYQPTNIQRPAKQVTMIYNMESPYHSLYVRESAAINWTATYRRDSDIVEPYGRWQYYDSHIHQQEQDRNYAANKTKKVAWFVSNCYARNGRLEFAQELGKYIEVDIYGDCGRYKCHRAEQDICFKMLNSDYKFYLAFENSNCRDYITEKLFVNALNNNILPIVMGARPEDYKRSAPKRSYIHVDNFRSVRSLAAYLHTLDKNDRLYNTYFKWKGTGEFIDTKFWCRVCAALHDEESLKKPRWYPNVVDWWNGYGVCTTISWRYFNPTKDVFRYD